MSEMKKLTLENFTNELASNSPAPGGGSVAALSSSLAASLASMVFNLTVGKKAYQAYDEEIKSKFEHGIAEAGRLKEELLNLMDEDTAAFNEVMEAFKLPKETEEEKEIRSIRVKEAYKKATLVPFKVAEKTLAVFDLLETAVQYGNANAISDAGVGTHIALTGIEGAVLNVRINLHGIKDTEFVNTISKKCSELVNAAEAKKEHIIGLVNGKM